jgi:hypothetical protein
MSKEKIELMAISWAEATLVQDMKTITKTAPAPPLPAMA